MLFLILIIVAIVAMIMIFRSSSKETFDPLYDVNQTFPSNFVLSERDYKHDFRVRMAYLSNFITDIYLHLRDQYFQAIETPFVIDNENMFKPDPLSKSLDDPYLPVARKWIKEWLDAQMKYFKRKYDMETFSRRNGVDYDISPTGRLIITVVQDGKKELFVV